MSESDIRDNSNTAPDFAEPARFAGRVRLQSGSKKIAGFTSELLILGAKDAAGNVIVLGPRSEVGIGEPIF